MLVKNSLIPGYNRSVDFLKLDNHNHFKDVEIINPNAGYFLFAD